MKKQLNYHALLVLLILVLNWTPTGRAIAASSLLVNSKTLTTGRAIANWPSGIPAGEKRPVLIFLPGWGGVGAVNASISAQNTNLVNEGYVTLAIGFDSSSTWISDIDIKTLQGLDKLCIDAVIPANCNAIVLDGESYGGAQNYWVMEYLRSNGYDGSVGSKGKVLGFISEDAGYGAPGTLTNPTTGAFTRTGLADTASYAVAMIQNLGDTTFPVDECTWGNCGARILSNAHLARGDNNVFSICPLGGEHGTRGFANWNAWVISAVKTMIHVTYAIPAFTEYTAPTLAVSNACVNAVALPGLSVSGINIVANGQPVRLRGVNMGDPFGARNPSWYPMYSIADYATLAQQWHANVVRISIFPTQWKNMDHATLLAGLAQEVNAALNNGMYVIISYHVIGWPNGFYQSACCGNAADTYDSSMSVATSFWTQMAQTYGSDTRIIFDLWNEPVHDSADWQHADPNPYWTELKSFYESLIQTVRNNGAKNIVLATGNSWANWLVGIKDNPLSDSKVVYAYHQYSVNGSNTAAEWNKNTGGLIGVKPVIVSEWGYEDADVTNPTWPGTQASCGDPFTQWMENNNLSNLAWMYHHDWTPALLKADGSLTLYGTFVKNYIFEKNNLPQNVIITDTWAVKVSPSANVTQLALQLGAQNLGQIGSLTGYYLFSIPGSSSQTNTVAAILASNSQVLWFEQQVAHQQSTRENANEESLAEIITATATMDDVQSQDNVDNASATNIPPASTQTAITIIESSPVPSQLPVFTQTIVPLLQVSPVPTQTPLVQIQPSSIPTTFIQSAKMAVLLNEPSLIHPTIPSTDSENNSGNGGTIAAILITLSLAAGGIIFTLRRVK